MSEFQANHGSIQGPACSKSPVLFVLAFFVCLFSVFRVEAADVALKEEQVTAAFIYNFVKFVTWPDGRQRPDQEKLNICANEPDSLGGALATLNNRSVERFTLAVQYLRNGEEFPVSSCDVLYIAEESAEAELPLESEKNAMLVIGHSQPGDKPMRSIVFRKVENKIRFDIYLGEANRAGLEVSSFLLKLALNVYE